MVVIRGTKTFLERVGAPASEAPPSTTVLGDWYAKVLFWRPHVAMFVNERTLLPLLVPLAPANSVTDRLRATAETVLGLHALSKAFIAHELAAMADTALSKTANRSVVGVLNEFASVAGHWRTATDDLIGLSLQLATVPCGPLYATHIDPKTAVAAAADAWVLDHA